LTTVSKIVPGTGGAVAPQITSGYRAEPYPGAGQNIQLGTGLGYYQARYAQPRNIVPGTQRPLSTNPLDIENTIDVNAIQYTQAGPEEQTQEQFWRKMGVRTTQRTGLAEKRLGEKGLLKGVEPNIGFYLGENQPGQPEAAVGWTMRQSTVAGTQENIQPDVYEQMKMQTGKTVKPAKGITEKGGEGDIGKILGAETGLQRTEVGGPSFAKATEGKQKPADSNQNTGEKAGAGVKTEDVLLLYKSFASYHDDKFNKNIRLAEYYMKQGKFYRAADAYTMATVYKPQDPLGYAGKSIAMFATGEYMSSSLFLAKTLEIFPEYAKVRVDIVAIIGDKDTVENRILEAREWFDRSQSGELAFLLSYVYYQMDRLEFARQAIGFAAQQMPDSQAVATLKKAIEERIAKP
jgi:tetratricopeptide (TPR) repeat protein